MPPSRVELNRKVTRISGAICCRHQVMSVFLRPSEGMAASVIVICGALAAKTSNASAKPSRLAWLSGLLLPNSWTKEAAAGDITGGSEAAPPPTRFLTSAWANQREYCRISSIMALRSCGDDMLAGSLRFIRHLLNEISFVLLQHSCQVSALAAQVNIVLQSVQQERCYRVGQFGIDLLYQPLL